MPDFNNITPAVLARMGSREARKVQESPDNHARYDVSLFSPSFQLCICVNYILNLVLIYYSLRKKYVSFTSFKLRSAKI